MSVDGRTSIEHLARLMVKIERLESAVADTAIQISQQYGRGDVCLCDLIEVIESLPYGPARRAILAEHGFRNNIGHARRTLVAEGCGHHSPNSRPSFISGVFPRYWHWDDPDKPRGWISTSNGTLAVPARAAGVYAVFDETWELIYVGRSFKCVRSRLNRARREKDRARHWTAYVVRDGSPVDEIRIHNLEAEMIARFDPSENVVTPIPKTAAA